MEQRYKDALRQIYRDKLVADQVPTNYAFELFKSSKSYFMKPKTLDSNTLKPEASSAENEVKSVTEKTIILDSLHQFGQEKLAENDNKPVSVEGGEIHPKDVSQSGYTNESTIDALSEADLQEKVLDLIGQDLVDLRSLNKTSESIKVIFVSDSFNEKLEGNIPEEVKEFESLFEKDTALLFSKMVKAMKLSSEQYVLSAIKYKDQNLIETVLNEIHYYQPQLIISLGVSASHALLNISKRLKDIHGKFYNIKINDYSCEVMPLFSPSLLNTAVHMKKMAWEDMQKAMSHLGL